MTGDVENDGNRGPIVTARDKRLADIAATAATLDANDLAILAWIVERLPVSNLRGQCLAATMTGRCDALAPNTYEATPREYVAIGALFHAVHDISVAVHGRGVKGTP